MTDLVLYENGGHLTEAEEELLFERVASLYLEMQDERPGKKIRVADAVTRCVSEHPEYSTEIATAAVKCAEFDEYLAGRRKDHMVRRLVPSLLAAEQGAAMSALAMEQLMQRLEGGEEIDTRDLIAIAKTGAEFAAKVDRQVEEVTGTQNVSVNLDLKSLLLGLPAEMAQSYMAEIGRRMVTEGK